MGKISKKTLHDIHIEQTGIGFNDPDFKFLGGDQGDGTYKNFIIFSDYSDMDVIRVEEDYYAVTSTFHLNPGISILHSKDLVNWSIIGHAVDDLSKLHTDFSFNTMRAYGDGIWAPSIRYHNKEFFIHVGGPKIGLIVCKAKNIQGPWKVKRLKLNSAWDGNILIDCCPIWDEDGQAYFVAAEPRWYQGYTLADYKMYLFKMSEDGESLLDDGVVVHGGSITEAVKLYKINGYYYMFYCEHPSDENLMRTQFAARSKNIYGPYERRKLIHSHGPDKDLNPSQGGLVETSDGKWYFLCHGMNEQAPAAAIGRPMILLPVTWVDGWPIIGADIDNDGVGEMVWHSKKPIDGFLPTFPQSSDEFETDVLGLQWQWNHVPRNDRWSLSERPGFLRLKACKSNYPGGFYAACNTITQRLSGDESTATALLSTQYMADGQYAGLCIMSNISQLIGIYFENGKKYIRYQYSKKLPLYPEKLLIEKYSDEFYCEDIMEFNGDRIWLQLKHRGNMVKMYFSLDGEIFKEAYEEMKFGFFAWRGGRVGFYSWNDFEEKGNADFEWFRYSF